MRYRSEIDGLRAVAVMPVILFHAGFNIFSGGFVGVDIFFVISGFLITKIILTELKNDNFSILKFYERRARRILPALFTVIAVSFPLAWMILLPSDMWNFSHTMITVSGFYSNIFFWKTSGYFESAAELKPLLHTWSLAVEEQYYVFFPLFLLIAWRFGQRAIMVILLIVGCVSLALAQWGAIANPDAAFYLLPTRGWELLIGAFVAFYDSSENKRTLSHLQNQILSAIGLGLLLYALFRFDKHTPFPSVYALVPTVGAALIILAATQDTFVGKLLGSKAFVGIGLISYSAYLWHQPLLAFARHASFDQPSESTYALLVTVSLVLAYFTWKYIEAPFRNHQKVGRKTIFVFAVVGSLTMAGVGEYGKLDHGHQNRFGLAQRAMLDYFSNTYPDWQYFKRVNWYTKFHIECDFFDIPKEWEGHPTQERKSISPSCYTRDPSKKHAVFLWGDSHAQHFYIGLKDNLPSDWQIMQVASSACRPSLKFDKNSGNYCPYSNYFAYQTILDTKPDVVVIGQDGGHNLAFMNEVTARLTRAGVGKVVFAGPSPHWLKGGLPSVVAYKFNGEPPRYSSVGLDQSVREHDALLKQGFKQTPNARYVSLFDYFCHADGCLIYYGDDVKAGITTYDYGHLATPASDQFAKDVLVPTIIGVQ